LIVLLALGFPVALVVSWIFDLTPEGIVRTSDDPAAEMASLRMGRRIDFAIIGSLLIVGGLMFWRTVPPPESEELPLSDKPSIAVLPFCNLSGDPEQEYFSDGITEDLTAVLSRSPELLVISRTSSSLYDCQPSDLKQVGHELGVHYAVEGSVRRAQDRVRITAQLIDVTTDVHVWSQSYERDLTPANVFEIQSEIARQISNTLQVQLIEWEGARPTANPTAWDLFIQARYLVRRISSEEVGRKVRRLFERANELDPGFVPAYAGLAAMDLGAFKFSLQPDTELLDRAESRARRALAVDPQDSLAHFTLGGVLETRGKPIQAIREYRQAIELNPSFDFAYSGLGKSQMKLGRFEEAKRSFDRLQQISPRFPTPDFWANRGTLHYLEHETEQAVALWEKARTMGSFIASERIMLSHYYESAGRHEDAQDIVQEMLSTQPELTAEKGIEMLARLWNEEWIPEDLEAQLRSAGLP